MANIHLYLNPLCNVLNRVKIAIIIDWSFINILPLWEKWVCMSAINFAAHCIKYCFPWANYYYFQRANLYFGHFQTSQTCEDSHESSALPGGFVHDYFTLIKSKSLPIFQKMARALGGIIAYLKIAAGSPCFGLGFANLRHMYHWEKHIFWPVGKKRQVN